jgi:predicted metal-dependent hydrolase
MSENAGSHRGPGGKLAIHAPDNTAAHELTQWTRSKLLWVHRTLTRKEVLAPKVRAPEFVSGENFSYLGRNYRLKIVRESEEPLRFDGTNFRLAADAWGRRRRISTAGISAPDATG